MLVLITGWFSFEDGHATAGDLLAAEVVRGWLDENGIAHRTAAPRSLGGDVDLDDAEAGDYEVVVFVCGPFERKPLEAELFRRFAGCRLIGIDLTLAERIGRWNPFDVLLERDSPESGRPDLVFSAGSRKVPVVGVCLVEEYEGGLTHLANDAIARLLERFDVAPVPVDTRLPENLGGLRSPRQVEAMLARVDAVVTTRLHGLVLALKNGVPALPIDPAPGGGKIVRQAETIGWPVAFAADALIETRLDEALRFCLTEGARSQARDCADRALEILGGVREAFLAALDAEEGAGGTDPVLREHSRAQLAQRLAPAASGRSGFGLAAALRRMLSNRSAPRTVPSKRSRPPTDPQLR